MKIIFENVDKGGRKLNSYKFSTKLKPGYCFGMSIDWAKTSLTYDGVRYKDMLNPMTWPIIQSSYEINQHKTGAPDEPGMIENNGLKILNGGGVGEEVPFNHDFNELARKLVAKVGTHIIILFGLPGAGAHFMGFRRKGAANFLLAEFFDPNGELVRYDTEREFIQDVGGWLTYAYTGQHPGDPVLNEYCGLASVTLAR